jgi:hypothetical protein
MSSRSIRPSPPNPRDVAAPSPVPAGHGPRLLKRAELAEVLRVHAATIDRLILAGMPYLDVHASVPAGRRTNRTPRFDLDAVMRWMNERQKRSA